MKKKAKSQHIKFHGFHILYYAVLTLFRHLCGAAVFLAGDDQSRPL